MYLSVIVPVYNGEETIKRCLNALVNQKGVEIGSDYEIVVVDDGSTDRTFQIASKFPVRIHRLDTNKGRIIARLVGAQKASAEKLLFVDSRVILDENAISGIKEIGYSPLMAGDLKEKENKYESIFHTFFYLIRRQIYGKNFFPQHTDELWITKRNFHRAPKGTTVLFIKRSLFLKIIPKRTGKDVSDDTLLLHNLVYNEGVNLLRHRLVKAEYLQRTRTRDLVKWLYWRGILFSDYYLRPGGRFFMPFVSAVLIFITAFLALAIMPSVGLYIFLVVFGIYVSLMIHLSENIKDFLTLSLTFPFLSVVFLAGVTSFWIKETFCLLIRIHL